ncbi:MAG: hypothetical protein V1840_01645 [Candidatus Omnitrophota bacterium]
MNIVEIGIGAAIGALGQHIVTNLNEKKVKLIYYIHNISYFEITIDSKQPTLDGSIPVPQKIHLYSHYIFIKNTGNLSAQNIEVKHAHLPKYLTVLPSETVSEVDRENEIVRITQIRPKEEISISYLDDYAYRIDDIFKTIVKSDAGYAKGVPVAISQIYSKRVIRLLGILVIFGILFVLYLLYFLMPYLINFVDNLLAILFFKK